jgi:hypothetical protein
MGSADEGLVAMAMQAILDYLRAHPKARDTAAGIHQWWLPDCDAAAQLDDVEEALERLAAAGRIRSQTLPGGAVVYGGGQSSG